MPRAYFHMSYRDLFWLPIFLPIEYVFDFPDFETFLIDSHISYLINNGFSSCFLVVVIEMFCQGLDLIFGIGVGLFVFIGSVVILCVLILVILCSFLLIGLYLWHRISGIRVFRYFFVKGSIFVEVQFHLNFLSDFRIIFRFVSLLILPQFDF